MDYTYKQHIYKDHIFIKSTYGGSWRIHELESDGEFNVFKPLTFVRTLGEAKQYVDKKIEREKKRDKKR